MHFSKLLFKEINWFLSVGLYPIGFYTLVESLRQNLVGLILNSHDMKIFINFLNSESLMVIRKLVFFCHHNVFELHLTCFFLMFFSLVIFVIISNIVYFQLNWETMSQIHILQALCLSFASFLHSRSKWKSIFLTNIRNAGKFDFVH